MSGRAIASALIVVTLGTLLHFAWFWSGRSAVVAVFAATNESTWEHLKLAFWPALLLAPFQRWLYAKPPGWLVATTIRAVLPPLSIVALFYGTSAILGTHHLVLDIGIFVVAVFIGELVGHSVMHRRTRASVRAAAAAALAIAVVAFSTLTFRPPSWFLFEDPVGGAHGEAAVQPGM